MSPLDEFEVRIKTLQVKDFGDFRRKSNLYLNRLAQSLPQGPAGPVLKEMKNFINFEPDWKMESTRLRILEKVQQLRRTLGSQAQAS